MTFTKRKKGGFYVMVKNKEKPQRKTIVDEAVKAVQNEENVEVNRKSVMAEVEKREVDGEGKKKTTVGRSAMERTVREAVAEVKKNTPAKKQFEGDDDVLLKSKSVKY